MIIGSPASRPGLARADGWPARRHQNSLGCRRYPAQLLEASAALIVGLGGQSILPLRAEPPRRWRCGRRVITAAAAVALLASVLVLGLR